MNVIKPHKCLQRGKTWYPRRPGTPRICPICKTTTGTRQIIGRHLRLNGTGGKGQQSPQP